MSHGLAFRLHRRSRAALRPNARPYAYPGVAHSARRLRSLPSLCSSRAKSTTKYRRRYSHPGDESGGVRCDRTIALSGVKSVRDYPQPLRRTRYHDVQTSKTFNFLTNNFAIPAQTAPFQRRRWRISTDTTGKLNCSSSGSSNTYIPNRSSGPPRMRSKARFGSLSRVTSSSLSSRIALTAIRIST